MHSSRTQQAIISSHAGRIVQKAMMLSGLKWVYICLKIIMSVSMSGERNTAQLHTIKMSVMRMQNSFVNHVSGIL